MSEPVDIFLGFDPGGSKGRKFGWSICKDYAGQFMQHDSGRGTHAKDVVSQVLNNLPPNVRVRAAGIDAPLFWDSSGKMYRRVDEVIEGAGGSPVSLNGLYGSVIYQGPVLARLLMQRFEGLAITETFPSALRKLLNPLPPELNLRDKETGHERDARTAAYAAWCMYRQAPGWENKFLQEQQPLLLLDFPVSYWLPIPGQDQGR